MTASAGKISPRETKAWFSAPGKISGAEVSAWFGGVGGVSKKEVEGWFADGVADYRDPITGFEEEKIERRPKGDPRGGQFAPKSTAGNLASYKTVAEALGRLPPKARTEEGAEQYFKSALRSKDAWERKYGNGVGVLFFHETPGDVVKSVREKGVKGDYGVFAAIGHPSDFVSTETKTVTAFRVPADELESVGPDMMYGGDDNLGPYQMLLLSHPGLTGAYVSFPDEIPPNWVHKVQLRGDSPTPTERPPIMAFHGTTDSVIDKIVHEGITVKKDIPRRSFASEYYEGERGESVFITRNADSAEYFARSAAGSAFGERGIRKPIVFFLEIPEEEFKKFKTDEKLNPSDEAFYGKHIKPEWIKSYTRIPTATGQERKVVKVRDAVPVYMVVFVDDSVVGDAEFEEEKYERRPKGDPRGGQFAPKSGVIQPRGFPIRPPPRHIHTTIPPVGHPGPRYSKEAWVDVEGRIHTTKTDDAIRALWENRDLVLNQPRQVSVLINKLAIVARRMEKLGIKRDFNLCRVVLEGASLFCTEVHEIPRLAMPQLKGPPLPGTPAEQMPADVRGEVDTTDLFKQHLLDLGYEIEDGVEYASYLRPTQNELNGAKVGAIAGFVRQGKLDEQFLFTTRDDYIIDGHHRWAAQVAVDFDDNQPGDFLVPVYRVNAGIIEILAEARRFAKRMGIPQSSLSDFKAMEKKAKDAAQLGFEFEEDKVKRQPKGDPRGGQFAPKPDIETIRVLPEDENVDPAIRTRIDENREAFHFYLIQEPIEDMRAVDLNTGEPFEFSELHRSKSSVSFGMDDSEVLMDPDLRVEIHHNHPSGSSLSGGDLYNIASHPGIAAGIAVDKYGGWFRASGIAHPRVGDLFTEIYKEGSSRLTSTLPTQHVNETTGRLFTHIINDELHNRKLLNYEFKLAPDLAGFMRRHRDVVDKMRTMVDVEFDRIIARGSLANDAVFGGETAWIDLPLWPASVEDWEEFRRELDELPPSPQVEKHKDIAEEALLEDFVGDAFEESKIERRPKGDPRGGQFAEKGLGTWEQGPVKLKFKDEDGKTWEQAFTLYTNPDHKPVGRALYYHETKSDHIDSIAREGLVAGSGPLGGSVWANNASVFKQAPEGFFREGSTIVVFSGDPIEKSEQGVEFEDVPPEQIKGILVVGRRGADAEFEEEKIKRRPKGDPRGGQFAEKPDTAQFEKDIRNYIDIIVKMQGHLPDSAPSKLLQQYGRTYQSSDGSYSGKRGPQHMCYMNAGRMARDNPDTTYVEGYITVYGVPVEHAWVVDNKTGEVIDPTLKDGKGLGGYFGVPIDRDFLMNLTTITGYWGVFGYESIKELLKHKPEEIVAGGPQTSKARRGRDAFLPNVFEKGYVPRHRLNTEKNSGDPFEEDKIERRPKGDPRGGQFAPKGGAEEVIRGPRGISMHSVASRSKTSRQVEMALHNAGLTINNVSQLPPDTRRRLKIKEDPFNPRGKGLSPHARIAGTAFADAYMEIRKSNTLAGETLRTGPKVNFAFVAMGDFAPDGRDLRGITMTTVRVRDPKPLYTGPTPTVEEIEDRRHFFLLNTSAMPSRLKYAIDHKHTVGSKLAAKVMKETGDPEKALYEFYKTVAFHEINHLVDNMTENAVTRGYLEALKSVKPPEAESDSLYAAVFDWARLQDFLEREISPYTTSSGKEGSAEAASKWVREGKLPHEELEKWAKSWYS